MDRIITFRLDEKLYKKIEKIATNTDRSISWWIRRACTDYFYGGEY